MLGVLKIIMFWKRVIYKILKNIDFPFQKRNNFYSDSSEDAKCFKSDLSSVWCTVIFSSFFMETAPWQWIGWSIVATISKDEVQLTKWNVNDFQS